MNLTKIITHPGGAHKDDLLACSLMAATSGASIYRRDPTEEELDDPTVCVIDVGHRHEPELLNFDHHQFPRDHVPTCALSLVLRHLGVYEDARLFCDWLEPAEWFDTRGPQKTAEFLGVPRRAVTQLNSPVDVSILKQFSKRPQHASGELLYDLLCIIGQDLLDYLHGVRAKLDLVSQHSEQWTLESGDDRIGVLFLPRGNEAVEDASGSMFRFIQVNNLEDKIAVMVYPDTRGAGYGMARFNDHPRMDFTRIEEEEEVHFAHKSGFLAKVTTQDKDRLKVLVAQGWGEVSS